MNRVVTTNASITAGQPIVANAGLGTLPFMEDGYQEAMANIVKGLLGIYTANDLIVLIDPLIIISGGGNTATWTAGAIFYNDEIYTIPAGTLTKAGGDVFLYVISDTPSLVLDPVYYKDGSQHYPHRVRQITISSGVSGTGIADYGGATVKYNFPGAVISRNSVGSEGIIHRRTKQIEIGDWNMDSTDFVTVNHGISNFLKIREIKATIIRDDSSVITPLDFFNYLLVGGEAVQGGVLSVGASNLILNRRIGGVFDDTNYDSTSFNRGWISIEYEV